LALERTVKASTIIADLNCGRQGWMSQCGCGNLRVLARARPRQKNRKGFRLPPGFPSGSVCDDRAEDGSGRELGLCETDRGNSLHSIHSALKSMQAASFVCGEGVRDVRVAAAIRS
jgi:hypothetical protein